MTRDLFDGRSAATVVRRVCAVSLVLAGAATTTALHAASSTRLLDGFEDAAQWQAHSSPQVKASLRAVAGARGQALCLDYDFNGAPGYASARRELPVDPPDNYTLELDLRGDAPTNQFRLKLASPDGKSDWWYTAADYKPTPDWRTLRIKRREIDPPWFPQTYEWRHKIAIELVVSNAKEGGRGSVCFDELRLQEWPVSTKPPASISATSALSRYPASLAMDGKSDSAWRSDPRAGARQDIVIDFGEEREFGGAVLLQWQDSMQATDYDIQFSSDSVQWTTVQRVKGERRRIQPQLLPTSVTRFVRLQLHAGVSDVYGLAEIEAKEPPWGFADADTYFEELAKVSPRGQFPRGVSGEQPYWTVVSVDGGGANSALMSEDGAVEVGRGGFSIEPFVVTDGKVVTWADVATTQSLQDGYLPIPSVHWSHPQWGLDITSFATGSKDRSRLLASYVLINKTQQPLRLTLALAARPFRVGPPTQWLGGVHPNHALAWNGESLSVDGQIVSPLQRPDGFVASTFASGSLVEQLGAAIARTVSRTDDPAGYANGAMLFNVVLPPKGRHTIGIATQLSGAEEVPSGSARERLAWLRRQREQIADEWRNKLNRVGIELPPAGRKISDTVRSALAQILMSRDGPALQPGTRAYSRSWIRDGAMMVEGLLRLGHSGPAGDFVRWFAPFQYPDGKVPCCVDRGGVDPLPEHDSHGELVFSVAQLYRYTGDRKQLTELWPYAEAAVRHMESLRQSERIPENRTGERKAYWGMMPKSASHEGYTANPVHAYWDDFWALRGFKDAAWLATVLGHTEAAKFAAQRDEFHKELIESLVETAAQHGISYLAGSAELGDFDATATTIALAPGNELGRLPQRLLENTFDRYWRDFIARREGKREWKDYVPYEIRVVGSYVRLNQPERALEALQFFFADQQPPGWNQWPEVVRRDRRKPGFIGDLPHAWVSSDYIRSALDLFAYERESDDSLILAAGVPHEWLTQGVAVRGLATTFGSLGYRLRRAGGVVHLDIDKQTSVPSGGLRLVWPGTGPLPRATIDGRTLEWQGRELPIHRAPANVRLYEK